MNEELKKRQRRKKRVKSRLNPKGWPRLSVSRSNRHIYGQIIDDGKRETLVAVWDGEVNKKISKTEKAKFIGELLAQKALKKGVKQVVFDRGFLKYHGRIKALAEGARKGGLKF